MHNIINNRYDNTPLHLHKFTNTFKRDDNILNIIIYTELKEFPTENVRIQLFI